MLLLINLIILGIYKNVQYACLHSSHYHNHFASLIWMSPIIILRGMTLTVTTLTSLHVASSDSLWSKMVTTRWMEGAEIKGWCTYQISPFAWHWALNSALVPSYKTHPRFSFAHLRAVGWMILMFLWIKQPPKSTVAFLIDHNDDIINMLTVLN